MIAKIPIAAGNTIMPPINELQSLFKGKILIDGDDGYEEARKIWNGMIDRKPAIIAQCANSADVQQAVNFSVAHNLLISIRSGGHNVSGNAVCNGGIMIDLSKMKDVKVYPDKKLAHVQMGATWGDFDKAAQQHGLA